MHSQAQAFRKLVDANYREVETLLETIRQGLPQRKSYQRLHDRHLARRCVYEKISTSVEATPLVDVIKTLNALKDQDPPRNRVFDPDYYRECWIAEIAVVCDLAIEQLAPRAGYALPKTG